jgi:hypothetical protein
MTSDNQTKVFLGGTCNGSTWREELIPLLGINYFNPVVEEWTDRARLEEIEQRKNCDFCLYVITPEMKGFYSIAEVVDDSNKRPEKVILCILKEANGLKFDDKQYRSLMAVADMVLDNGATVCDDLPTVASILKIRSLRTEEKTLDFSSGELEYIPDISIPISLVHHFWGKEGFAAHGDSEP